MISFEKAPKQHIQREKEKARLLRKSSWWTSKVQREKKCHYCSKAVTPQEVTMDHILPISRGGKTTKGNLAVCCKDCNSIKKYYTPVEWQFFINSEQTK